MSAFEWSLDRRQFLKLSLGGLAMLLQPRFSIAEPMTTGLKPKRFVLLEMNGGNDGLNTFIPYADPAYAASRPMLAIKPEQVLPLNGVEGFGLHPALVKLQQRFNQGQVAIVQGIGHPQPDLSHFAMMDYWRAGHLEGMSQTGQTGWVGRIMDELAAGRSDFIGLSIADTIGPVILAEQVTIAAVDSRYAGELDIPEESLAEVYRKLLYDMTANKTGHTALDVAAQSSALGLDLAELLVALPENKVIYPNTDTGYLLGLAAQVLALPATVPVQMLHIPLPLDFDTHVDQQQRHQDNLAELDAALAAFIDDLTALGMDNDTLIMTSSEFGRRVAENKAAGTDHGTANVMFLMGNNVKGGVHGAAPSLTDLDAEGNLKATGSFLDVLATVSDSWMGVPAATVIPDSQVMDLFV